jgi:hypothetical protein
VIIMKLAEALVLRADHQRRVLQLKQRLLQNAKVQEGDQPAENPQALIDELERVAADLTDLIQRINRTNSVTELEAGLTLSDALAVRDNLRTRHAVYRELAQAGIIQQTRYSRSEVRFESTINVADVQKRADQLAREHRDLDTRIQAANWLTDLLE